MLLRYFYDQKLAQASYFVGCQATGEALVIDPARHVEPYLATAEAEGMRLVAAAETHIHADFVSGARELAERTGATLYLSDAGDQDWKYLYADQYRHVPLRDGDTFCVGNIHFEVWHTPGHTPEHISFLMTDTAGANRPMGLFSGDFVFAGDVGRPDLLEKAAGIANTAETGARQMFHSLQRFKGLPDYLQLWPGHGAGSACGKALGAIPSSTIGYEKLFNWALSMRQKSHSSGSYWPANQNHHAISR
jgi:hydroxyacylglutathione hydrolase